MYIGLYCVLHHKKMILFFDCEIIASRDQQQRVTKIWTPGKEARIYDKNNTPEILDFLKVGEFYDDCRVW